MPGHQAGGQGRGVGSRRAPLPVNGRVAPLPENVAIPEPLHVSRVARFAPRGLTRWTSTYIRHVAIADACCALAAGVFAFEVRFGDVNGSFTYFWAGLIMPPLWLAAIALAGAYDARFIGVGTDEFRRVLNAGVSLTAVVAFAAFVTKTDIARGYIVLALPAVIMFDLLTRYALRKRLHRRRALGQCMRRAVLVGHSDVVEDLAAMLRRDTHHGLAAVAACVLGPDVPKSIDGLPVVAGLANVVDV